MPPRVTFALVLGGLDRSSIERPLHLKALADLGVGEVETLGK